MAGGASAAVPLPDLSLLSSACWQGGAERRVASVRNAEISRACQRQLECAQDVQAARTCDPQDTRLGLVEGGRLARLQRLNLLRIHLRQQARQGA